jgi:hypothetical protein
MQQQGAMEALHIEKCVHMLLHVPLSKATEEDIYILRVLLAETNSMLAVQQCSVLACVRELLDSRLLCEHKDAMCSKEKKKPRHAGANYMALRPPTNEEWVKLVRQKVYDIEHSSRLGLELDYTKVMCLYIPQC